MRFSVLTRKIHYWTSILIAAPLLVIIGTGLLLQIKKQSDWVQPHEHRGSVDTPAIELSDILASVRGASDSVASWDDIERLDMRPRRGLVKVLLRNGLEVQVDLGNGAILQTAYRRSDLIESLHDGSWFGGDWTKLGLFLPTGLSLLLLVLTGLWLFWLPFSVRRRRARMANLPDPAAEKIRRS